MVTINNAQSILPKDYPHKKTGDIDGCAKSQTNAAESFSYPLLMKIPRNGLSFEYKLDMEIKSPGSILQATLSTGIFCSKFIQASTHHTHL
jgi:hypothetical protein